MTVKVLMTWDIAGERDQEYFQFIIGEFIPGVQRLGLQPAEAWATIYVISILLTIVCAALMALFQEAWAGEKLLYAVID